MLVAAKNAREPRIECDRPSDIQSVRFQAIGECLHLRLADHSFAEEQVAEPPGQPLGSRRVFQEDAGHVRTAEPARLPQDCLVAIIVSRGGLAELAIGDGPAGQGSGGFLDVGLAVMADPQGEELHQLAGQVLVGVSLAVGRRVEPDQERRVADHRLQQLAERLAGQAAERLVLTPHGRRVADLEDAGGEVVVPHQGQPLAQGVGREDQAEEPPRLEASRVARSDRGLAQDARDPLEHLGLGRSERPAFSIEQAVDAGLGTLREVAPDLDPARRKPGAAVQVGHTTEVPGRLGRWLITGPDFDRSRVFSIHDSSPLMTCKRVVRRVFSHFFAYAHRFVVVGPRPTRGSTSASRC